LKNGKHCVLLSAFLSKIMTFSTPAFALFFIPFFLLYALAFGKNVKRQNIFLLLGSYVFYAFADWRFLPMLIIVSGLNFFLGHAIEIADRRRGFYLGLGLLAGLGSLAYFKYCNFFIESIVDLLTACGLRTDLHLLNIIAPLGISFFTFRTVSYLLDIYYGKIRPTSDWIAFFNYVAFFPAIVAGPIDRARPFLEQLQTVRRFNRPMAVDGMRQILWGLFKKAVIADNCALFTAETFNMDNQMPGSAMALGLFMYAMQMYADFSGYTDIAIGVAMLFGFYLPVNFNSPYKATNAANFWKRWHISLSRWLQDYLYIPLGGNRNATVGTYACIISIALIAMILAGNIIISVIIILVGVAIFAVARLQPERRKKITTNLNNMDTMLLGGLWHGASWNFVIWGGLNGLGILIYKFWKDKSENCRLVLLGLLAAILAAFVLIFRKPVFNIGLVWVAVLFAVTALKFVLAKRKAQRRKNVEAEKGIMQSAMLASTLTSAKEPIANAWAVAQTFVFITFTRLFFRAGSNLDPAEANHEAWSTATGMVNRIGSQWDFSLICPMISSYSGVFSLIVAGMIIHWLPERWKRRYRLWFAGLPLAVMAVVVVVIVFIVYQFVTADLQKFIYFQF